MCGRAGYEGQILTQRCITVIANIRNTIMGELRIHGCRGHRRWSIPLRQRIVEQLVLLLYVLLLFRIAHRNRRKGVS